MVAPPTYATPVYSALPSRRAPPSLPFGWTAVTVLLIGAVMTIVGIVIILYAALGFITGTLNAALGSGGVLGIFSTMMGAMILFVIGGVLAGTGGWLLRFWWIFLLVGVVTETASANTARARDEMRTIDVRVRCTKCGRLNPEFVGFCMSCQSPI